MAADTAAKRYAAMLPLCPWRPLAVVPSGTVDDAERATGLYLYAGIPGGSPIPAVTTGMMWRHHAYGL